MMSQEEAFLKARQVFEQTMKYVEAAKDERTDLVERDLFGRLLQMGLAFLEGYVAGHGDGDEGAELKLGERLLKRLPETHGRRYLSIFGELNWQRYVYGTREGQKIEHVPLDARLGLPAEEISYVLEDWLERLCVKDAFVEAGASLETLLGLKVGVNTAERHNHKMAEYAASFHTSQVPAPQDEGELVVVAVDGKGICMRRDPDEVQSTAPVKQGLQKPPEEEPDCEKRKDRKRMAYVGVNYTIDRFIRTSQDVLDELRHRRRDRKRPRPKGKRVWAELNRRPEDDPQIPGTGREYLFALMAVECHDRDPEHQKPLICLLDGERSLWDLKQEWLPRAIGILDIFHVSERLWKVAHCLHARESQEAEQFVTQRLKMLLDGKVGYVTRGLRKVLNQGHFRGKNRKTVASAVTYFENNRDHMKYDEYLAAGYPIGSGAVEGACRHLVKDRMEQAGMKWRLEGADAMLHTRAIYLNGDWNRFVEHRIQKEQQQLYALAA